MKERIWDFEWKDELSIGVPEIDRDHQEGINLVSDLIEAIVDMGRIEEIHDRMQLILDHANRHFAREEELLRQWNYPDVDHHAREHEAIIGRFEGVKSSLDKETALDVWIEAGLEIRKTLIDHFLKEDLKYRNFRHS
jgi:hemerythrin